MENEYTITQAKNRLPSIVHHVEEGPSVTLTRRGRPVAVLLSIKEYNKLTRKKSKFWDTLTEFRKSVKNIDLLDSDFEDLRDRSSGRAVELV